VLLVVPPGLRGAVQELGLPHRLGADPDEEELAPLWKRFGHAPADEASVIANREIFGRLSTQAMLPTMREAAQEFRPELVLREPCEYASAITAIEAGVPHMQVAISLAAVEVASLAIAGPALDVQKDGLAQRLLDEPYLTRFPQAVDPSSFTVTVRCREAPMPSQPAQPLPDWWRGSRDPLVYLTLGTVAGSLPATAEVYRTALRAVADLPVRVLLTTGHGTDPTQLGSLPGNVHVERWAEQRDVLAAAAVVLCHGGSGTTFGALAAGVPLVVVPLFADQPANGRLVASLGAGRVVQATAGSDQVRAALQSVLTDDGYRSAARKHASELRGLPDADTLLHTIAEGHLFAPGGQVPLCAALGERPLVAADGPSGSAR